ncbi:MAG: SagB/ThcOx family dehydrogenase [Deltaproteobacteria bacterium]|nr:MAG: SagB/ThcOx family dehydrogenase [Deltaproteobacteria bacterium]
MAAEEAIEEAPSVDGMLRTNGVEGASLLVYLFMDFARPSLGKYGEKAYRMALFEAGHLAQNLLLVAAASGLAGVPLCGFDDEQLSLSAGLAFPQEAFIDAAVAAVANLPPGPDVEILRLLPSQATAWWAPPNGLCAPSAGRSIAIAQTPRGLGG